MSAIRDVNLTFEEQLCGAALFSPITAMGGYGIGALGACMTSVMPLAGGFFGATTALVMTFAGPIFFKLFESEKHPVISDVLSYSATLISSALISKVILSAAGIHLTMGNVAALMACTYVGIPLVFILGTLCLYVRTIRSWFSLTHFET